MTPGSGNAHVAVSANRQHPRRVARRHHPADTEFVVEVLAEVASGGDHDYPRFDRVSCGQRERVGLERLEQRPANGQVDLAQVEPRAVGDGEAARGSRR